MQRSVLSFALLLILSATAGAAPKRYAAPPLQLVGSRPLETQLGDPSMPHAQASWVEMIDAAGRTIDLEHFYFAHRPGDALQPVVDAIARASARGVRVRLLLDAGMDKENQPAADSMAKALGCVLRRIDVKRQGGGVQHSKCMVVDGIDAFVGSQNLDWRAMSQIHELGVRMRDPVLAGAVARVFERDWASADTTSPKPRIAANAPRWPRRVVMPQGVTDVWVGASPPSMDPGLPWDRDLIIDRIHAAKRSIEVQLLQYGVSSHGKTDSTLHRALLEAMQRGVQVRLIISDWAIGGRNESVLRSLARQGAEVRISRLAPYSGGYIPYARVEHCKFMVVDREWLWVGTSNWEPSYFTDTRNVGVLMHSVALAKQAGGVFERSWSAPSALAFGPETKLERTEHGAETPTGMKTYGE